jgi:hypothetical protein
MELKVAGTKMDTKSGSDMKYLRLTTYAILDKQKNNKRCHLLQHKYYRKQSIRQEAQSYNALK